MLHCVIKRMNRVFPSNPSIVQYRQKKDRETTVRLHVEMTNNFRLTFRKSNERNQSKRQQNKINIQCDFRTCNDLLNLSVWIFIFK